MANAIHTHTMKTRQTKDFDFVFIGEETLSSFYKTHQSVPPRATKTVSAFDRESLYRFHQEFKNLVIAANQSYLENEAIAWEDTSLRRPIEPHEIEWMEWANAPAVATPQQTIKPLTGPPLGTPPPVEMWAVKAIGVLVSLNLLFAGLIVSGTRVNHWLN